MKTQPTSLVIATQDSIRIPLDLILAVTNAAVGTLRGQVETKLSALQSGLWNGEMGQAKSSAEALAHYSSQLYEALRLADAIDKRESRKVEIVHN